MSFAPQRRALFRHPNFQKWCEHVVFCTFWLRNVLRVTTACTFSTSEPPKVVANMCVLCTFWLGNVLRATTACTFSTSELPKVVREWRVLYILFDLEMCFAPQRRALFWHPQLPKVVRTLVCFVHFDLEMCFAPQRRALFWHLNFQKRSGHWCVLYILTWKSASRHNGVQLFISHLASWLRTRRFSEPTFRPSGAPNHWKNTVFRDFSYLFAHLHLLSSYSFSSTLLSSNLSLLSASSQLCFSSVHIVGSFDF